MTSVLTIAIASGLALLILLIKMWELRRGRGLLTSLSEKTDPFFERIIISVVRRIDRTFKRIPAASRSATLFFENFFLVIIAKLQSLLARISMTLRGRMVLKKRGAVSFFLKDVADHKDHFVRE